jgi:hypothetical protein
VPLRAPPFPRLTRRAALALPLVLAACGGGEEGPPAGQQSFAPLDFSYLLPLRLNVASVEISDRYVPSGQPPDVSQFDPIQPVAALRLMAQQRLQAAGTTGRAVFIINDASLTRLGDMITGTMSVELDIYPTPGTRAGFAQATVVRQLNGSVGNLPAALYQLTRQMMDQMNVEFEYQVRHSLGEWLLPAGSLQPSVQTAPLGPPGQPLAPEQLAPPGPNGILPPTQPTPVPTVPSPIAPPAPTPFPAPAPGAPAPLEPPPITG